MKSAPGDAAKPGATYSVDERGSRRCILLPKTQYARGLPQGSRSVRTISPSPQHRDLAPSTPPPPARVPATNGAILSSRLATCSPHSGWHHPCRHTHRCSCRGPCARSAQVHGELQIARSVQGASHIDSAEAGSLRTRFRFLTRTRVICRLFASFSQLPSLFIISAGSLFACHLLFICLAVDPRRWAGVRSPSAMLRRHRPRQMRAGFGTFLATRRI